MLAGQWLGAPGGDQNRAGYASRTWGVEWWHRLGHVPLWEPELFGGMPYIGAGHGDIFYPTSFLRLVLPVATVINLNFVLHYVLAGLFTYLLLRRLSVSWTGSVVGGLAYELSGLIASYPSPGHDGKLFASAALPLACLALVLALRDKRWEGYGLPAVAVAALGAGAKDGRRLVLWVGGIGLLFLLVSLGAATPFYKLWWALMPMVKKTRAPGMAFVAVAFVVALFAGLGTERLERKEGGKAVVPWLVVAGVVALLAVTGVFGAMAQSLAAAVEVASGLQKVAAARANASAIMWGAFGSGLALGVTGIVALAALRDRLTPRLFALTLALVVSGDLWLNAQHFWIYAPKPEADLYRPDPVTERIKTTPLPYRVLDLVIPGGLYPGDVLMAFDIPQVLGYHGNEIRYYDDLLGRDDNWGNLRYLRLWDLLAVRYALAPAGGRNVDSIPGYKRVLDSAVTSAGTRVTLFERTQPQPYARVVPGAYKAPDSAVVVPTLVDPRIDYSRVVLFTPDQPVTPAPIREMPPPSPARATVTAWEPGRMTIALDPAPPHPSDVLVPENWYPDWRATVDAASARVIRGDYALITVPVPAGAKRVELTFRSPAYQTGKMISLASLLLLAAIALAPLAWKRRPDA